jgi:hypothetical protein
MTNAHALSAAVKSAHMRNLRIQLKDWLAREDCS